MSLTLAANDDGAIAEPHAPSTLVAFLARAVHDPAVDVSKLEAIYRMQRELVADERRAAFHRAMNAVQSEMQAVVRNAFNDQTRSKFATLEAVDAAIRPVYAKHGFALSFTETPSDAVEMKVTCIVSRDGHAETYFLSALSDTVGPQGKANKTHVQGVGSSVSYLRRYLVCMIFNIALKGDDNDGNRPGNGAANDTGEVLGRAAIDLLAGLIAETKTDERKLLAHMGFPDLTMIKDVPARDFARMKNLLLSKKNILAQRAARTARSAESERALGIQAANVR